MFEDEGSAPPTTTARRAAGTESVHHPGLPFATRSATTHTDLAVRALDMGIDVRVIHNASIMNAIGSAGLQLYNYGQTVSIPFFTESWRPDSFYDKIAFNKRGNLHTLCLLGTSDGGTAMIAGLCVRWVRGRVALENASLVSLPPRVRPPQTSRSRSRTLTR